MSNHIEILLKQKVQKLGEFLISICDDNLKKQNIIDSIIELPTYKILLFISFLDLNKVEDQIDDFIKMFKLIDTFENREFIKEYINYFIDVKKIINE
jgi:hypothetical protein